MLKYQRAHYHSLLKILSILVILYLASIAQPSTASTSQTIPAPILNVCLEGPPVCDYSEIQAALNASSSDATIRIGSGVYSEQLTLKSHVTLMAAEGITPTITAISGPLVSGTDLVSVTLRGLIFDGQDQASVGIDLQDSHLTIEDSVVQNLRGSDGVETDIEGGAAFGIRTLGTGHLIISNVQITGIRGGSGWAVQGGYFGSGDLRQPGAGGLAVALWLEGAISLTAEKLSISNMIGGASGNYREHPYPCTDSTVASAGRAVGVYASGDNRLDLRSSQLYALEAGLPCHDEYPYSGDCPGQSSAVGLQINGGTIHLVDTNISDLSLGTGSGSVTAMIIAETSATRIDRNMISNLSTYGRSALAPVFPHSPVCYSQPVFSTGIDVSTSESVAIEHNNVSDLGDCSIGMLAQDIDSTTIRGNQIMRLTGCRERPVAGIIMSGASEATIASNYIAELRGADGAEGYMGSIFAAGNATGIVISKVHSLSLFNNIVRSIIAGKGIPSSWPGGWAPPGGTAASIAVSDVAGQIQNNSFYSTSVPINEEAPHVTGQAIGLLLGNGTDILAMNNAIVAHGIGIYTTGNVRVTAGLNAFWDNGTDYSPTVRRLDNLYVNPEFVDPATGDFHLSPDSPLIDAGTNVQMITTDYDGNARPIDGTGDGQYNVDIGAYEYWPGLRHSSLTVDLLSAFAGDSLRYRLTILNPLAQSSLNVVFTDTIPAQATYVVDSLSTSAGIANYADGQITWHGELPAAGQVVVEFSLLLKDALAESYFLTNQGVLVDTMGNQISVAVTTLVNPHIAYFPLVRR